MHEYDYLTQQNNGYYGQQQQPYNPQYQYQMQMRQAQRQAETPYYAPTMSAPPQNYIKGRPVVSIDEARASQIDLDGSLYVFTDLANNKIYTKQINADGTASLNTYVKANENAAASSYVTRDEFNAALAKIQEAIKPASAPTEFKI